MPIYQSFSSSCEIRSVLESQCLHLRSNCPREINRVILTGGASHNTDIRSDLTQSNFKLLVFFLYLIECLITHILVRWSVTSSEETSTQLQSLIRQHREELNELDTVYILVWYHYALSTVHNMPDVPYSAYFTPNLTLIARPIQENVEIYANLLSIYKEREASLLHSYWDIRMNPYMRIRNNIVCL